jgi:hypothetical protein
MDSAVIARDHMFLIPDLRYKNEAKRIKERGGILVRINRGNLPPIEDPSHISEVDLDNWEDWDYVIDNNGSLEDFKQKIIVLASKITMQSVFNLPKEPEKEKKQSYTTTTDNSRSSDFIDHFFDDFTIVS